MSEPAATLTLRAAEVGSASAPPTREVGIVGIPRRVQLGGARAATAPVAVAPDDVVRVEFDNGLHLWMRADDLLRERGTQALARDGSGPQWTIDPAPRPGLTQRDGTERGERDMVGLGIKVLEFFGVDLKQKSAALFGRTFEERQLKGHAPGFYRCPLEPGIAPVAVVDGPTSLPAERPLLVFLHGTMSSVAGSFGDLWSTATDDAGQAAAALRRALVARYGDDVYALEHRSLTESPIQNALELVGQLPVGAQLHLVSHSRGGLVGELLCLAERDRRDDPLQGDGLDALFAADRTVAEQLGLGALDGAAAVARDRGYADDRQRLRDLLVLMDERRIRVRRFVRVACPARGTTLTSGRLDRWLSVVNLLTGNGLVADAADFLLAVVKERTDPRTLPGLEAMLPGSALTRLLQHPSLVTNADLSVIAGDVEGQGLWAQLKLLAVDWFYGSDHDLVVNTGSMVGGIRRPAGGARFLRDQGEHVTHFNYFANPKSIAWLVSGLTREDGSDAGFAPIAEARQEEPRWRSAVRQSRAATTPRPTAIVVPGTMGSSLSVRGKAVWLSYWSLLRGGLGDVGWGTEDVEVGDILDDFYGPLLEHLARTHRVEICPYDWRQSVAEGAKRLADKLEAVLPEAERSGQAVHIVAHSMGGLVSRAMIADGGRGTATWRRVTALPGSRLLMLGTPNRGSHEAVRWLTGSNPTEAKLALLDLRHGVNGIIDIVRRFPGMVELLPFEDPGRYARAALWQQLRAELGAGWPTVDEANLRAAAATWSLLLGAAGDSKTMVYVAGCQKATVADYQVVEVEDEARGPRKRIEYIATPEGDGTVTWASGRLAGVPMFYAPETAHDELCSNEADRRIFRGYVELLTTGTTDQLSTAPPNVSRAAGGEARTFVLPPLPVTDDMPDERAVRTLSFGGGKPARRAAVAPVSSVIEVSLRHGDLAYARHAVLVGHYLGDTIVSAELALDKRLRGALTRRRDLGLYPGASGSYAVFFNEGADAKPVGALVVGLGQVGELSPGLLETGVRDALLEYALQVIQRPDLRPPENPQPQGGPRRARASCLLVGTGAGALRVRDSIEAMLRGALAANRKLEAAELDQKVLIDRIEILEVYEDVALGAARELAAVLDSAVLGPSLRWDRRCIEEGEGRRQRRRFGTDASWWQRLEIVLDAHGDRLRFIATTDRARAEVSLGAGQLRLADAFIAQACGSAVSNADIAKTLFEMLLPNRLKESSPDQRDVVLLLDKDSARFPWEMLEDRWSHTGRPPAVAGGMLRQLKETEFRAPAAHAYENTVFVVGNPNLDGWDLFPDLPGARREAELVGRVFAEQGYATLASIDEKAEAILGGLHAKAWRVLHLAGHGAHEFRLDAAAVPAAEGAGATTPEAVSGMVIGRDTFLTPGDVDQVRYVPELVFINCCYLGKTQTTGRPSYNQLAANVGVQFIRMGVKAVIAAGWAVDDGAALTFAETFYRRLLGGDAFGEAVQSAREAAWIGHPGANTWGAYQCYGDPGYRLQRDAQGDTVTAQTFYYAPGELVADLRNLAESIRMTSKEQDDDSVVVARLRAQIEELLRRIPAHAQGSDCGGWLDRADVAAALGFAYGEGRQFADAVQWLNRALRSGVGDCPIRAAEQCANFEVRLAAQEWAALRAGIAASGRRGGAARARELAERQRAIAGRIDAAIAELDNIHRRASTPDRLGLLGSACKRLAWVQTEAAPRNAALLRMAEYYRSAWDLGGGQDDSYAFNNWAVGCLLLASKDPAYEQGGWRGALAEMSKRQSRQTLALAEEDPNLWRATGLADTEIVLLLLGADDEAECRTRAERAVQLYAAAFERGASLREIASIEENLEFLIELTDDWPPWVAKALKAVRASV